jgi:LysR family nitrogen assimilation transcriptional regulator
MILPSLPNAIRTVVEAACRTQDVTLDIVAEVDAVHTQLRMAAEGQGYTVLPRSTLSATAGAAGAADLAWAPIGTPALRNRLVLATSRSKPPTAAALAACALIQRVDWHALFLGEPAVR